MRYEHIIFDIDGTMLDTEQAILCSLQDTVRDIQGREIEPQELAFALGIPGEVALAQLGITDTQKANRLWNEHLLNYTPLIRLFDGIAELLDGLRAKGHRLGIITSKTRQELLRAVRHHAPFRDHPVRRRCAAPQALRRPHIDLSRKDESEKRGCHIHRRHGLRLPVRRECGRGFRPCGVG